MSFTDSTLSMFPSGAMSALFMAAIMGFAFFLISQHSWSRMSSSHLVGSSGRGTTRSSSFICSSVTFSPASLSWRMSSGLLPCILACLAILENPFLMISLIKH